MEKRREKGKNKFSTLPTGERGRTKVAFENGRFQKLDGTPAPTAAVDLCRKHGEKRKGGGVKSLPCEVEEERERQEKCQRGVMDRKP